MLPFPPHRQNRTWVNLETDCRCWLVSIAPVSPPPSDNRALLAPSYLSSCDFLDRTVGTGWRLLLPFAGWKPSCPSSPQSLCIFYRVWNEREESHGPAANTHQPLLRGRQGGNRQEMGRFCFTHLRFRGSFFFLWLLSFALLTPSSVFFCNLSKLNRLTFSLCWRPKICRSRSQRTYSGGAESISCSTSSDRSFLF